MKGIKMKTATQKKVFSSLHLSKEKALDEMVLLSSCQKLAEFSDEVAFYEKKYGTKYELFYEKFKKKKATFKEENDVTAWRFAVEGFKHWNNIMIELKDDS